MEIPTEIKINANNLQCRISTAIDDYSNGRAEFFRINEVMDLFNEVDDFLTDLIYD